MRSSFVLRTRLVLALFVLCAGILGARLYAVSIVNADVFREEAKSQYVAPIASGEERGNIFFSAIDGREPYAATIHTSFRIAIQPNALRDADAAFTAISAILSLDRDRFFTSAAKSDDPYEEVAFRIEEEDAMAVEALNIPGVLIVRERWRFYPAGERAAHTLGFVGYQGNERAGRYGLERYWEDTLARDGASLYVNFFAEIFSNVRSLVSAGSTTSEGDLVTTIEPTVEQKLEDVLADVSARYRARQVGGIVMDPKTGAVIAMAALPTFNPNTYNTEESPEVFKNPLVENVYEMGSIMKPLTVAAGLDVGAISPQTTYYDAGFILKSGYRISNYDGKGRGTVDMQEVLNQSLNTGAAFVVDRMGNRVFAEYMRAFGLGEETGVDLPNEAHGLMEPLASGVDVDYATASFGQGIAVTPIAMTRALAALGNGGKLISPHVVNEVRYRTGLVDTPWRQEHVRVLEEKTSEDITRMLVEVYDDALLGGELKQERYSIAAKTGTAQIVDIASGGYYPDRYLHSFFGYFPAFDPQFIVFLYMVEPQDVSYASQTLARPFDDLARFLINYYDVPPDR
jgi:cell division protein FtsI/penicillin-binding protein 2